MAYIKGQQEVQHAATVGIQGGELNRWYNIVKREHEDNLEQMVLTLQTLQSEFPEVVENFKTSHAAGLVLHHQRAMVEHMLHEGELSDLDAGNLIGSINKRLKQLYFQPLSTTLSRQLKRSHTARVVPIASLQEASLQKPPNSIGTAVCVPRAVVGEGHERMSADAVDEFLVTEGDGDGHAHLDEGSRHAPLKLEEHAHGVEA